MSSTKSHEIDMTTGPLISKILAFSIPLMLSGILQLLFNAADIIVVGQFTSSQAMAAVGSTGSLNNLIVNIFLGLSIGSSVLMARYYGAHSKDNIHDLVHTSILLSVLCGIVLVVLGLLLANDMEEAGRRAVRLLREKLWLPEGGIFCQMEIGPGACLNTVRAACEEWLS